MRRVTYIVPALAALVLVGMIGSPAYAASCSGAGKWTGACSNTGEAVVVEGAQNQGGSQGTDQNHRSNSGNSDHDAPAPTPSPTCTALCDRGNYSVEVRTRTLPPVSASDLASFTPTKPTLTGEPAGIGVAGMPTNVIASATPQDLTGRLFNQFDVTVRFTPAGYRFTYGDGSSVTSTTGGATWTTLHQADFTPTPTSHTYQARGTYPVTATTLYTATVTYANDTYPVDGYIEATTTGYSIRIVEVHTALVDKTCLENPTGPGC